MPNFRNDHYYDAPEEEETPICESCNEWKEWKAYPCKVNKMSPSTNGDYICTNPFCPDRFIPTSIYKGTDVIKMAEYIVELEADLEELKFKTRSQDIQLRVYEQEKQKKSEPVRDTEYQIGRMEDAYQYLMDDPSDVDAMRRYANEWLECKKIMRQQGE